MLSRTIEAKLNSIFRHQHAAAEPTRTVTALNRRHPLLNVKT